jgi:hypothetical protein
MLNISFLIFDFHSNHCITEMAAFAVRIRFIAEESHLSLVPHFRFQLKMHLSHRISCCLSSTEKKSAGGKLNVFWNCKDGKSESEGHLATEN